MSNAFLPQGVPQRATDLAQQIVNRDPSLPLQPEERQLVSRLLSDPSALPQAFWAALIDRVIVDAPAQIPVAQLQGFSQFNATHSFIFTLETRTSSTFGDLATVGPRITGLSDGKYVFYFGCAAWVATAGTGKEALMDIQINSAAVDGNDACVSEVAQPVSIAIAVTKTIKTGGNNSVTAKYASLDNVTQASFARRWLVAQRIGNA